MNTVNYGNDKTDIARHLKKLIEANQSLAEMESLEELLPRLLYIAKDVTVAEASSLLLYNPNRNVLEFASVADEILSEEGSEILKSSVELKMGEGIAGWVAENRRPLIIPDVQNDPRFFKQADQKTGFLTRNILSV